MNKSLNSLFYSNYRLIKTLLIFSSCLAAWFARFIQDDAFISFRYAKNFAAGKGLVYNTGEKVQGFTNFLWTIILSIPHYLNIDPILFSQLLGIILFGFSLFFLTKIAELIFSERLLVILTLLFTCTNYTFLSYATGGLETQLQAALLLACIFLSLIIFRNENKGYITLLSFIFAAIVLTRPDSAIFVIIIFVYMVNHFRKNRNIINNTLLLLIPLVVIVSVFIFMTYNYYGDFIPNTFYAKVSSPLLKYGLFYIYTFFTSYWLFIFPFLIIALLYRKDTSDEKIIYLTAFILTWILYILYIGGDFMEFRFFVPVIPLFFILVVKTLETINSKKIIIAIALFIIAGSAAHVYAYRGEKQYKILSVKQLKMQIYDQAYNWKGIGEKIKEDFYFPGVTIATTAAGAIPYYSELRTIDMHGLNDKWIAKHGKIVDKRPGHQRLATLDYLIEKNVNILVGDPFVAENSFELKDITKQDMITYFLYTYKEFPPASKIVKIPLDNNYCFIIINLTNSEMIDNVIKKNNYETIMLKDLFK